MRLKNVQWALNLILTLWALDVSFLYTLRQKKCQKGAERPYPLSFWHLQVKNVHPKHNNINSSFLLQGMSFDRDSPD